MCRKNLQLVSLTSLKKTLITLVIGMQSNNNYLQTRLQRSTTNKIHIAASSLANQTHPTITVQNVEIHTATQAQCTNIQ